MYCLKTRVPRVGPTYESMLRYYMIYYSILHYRAILKSKNKTSQKQGVSLFLETERRAAAHPLIFEIRAHTTPEYWFPYNPPSKGVELWSRRNCSGVGAHT